jgi:PhzF family phenazine biosynthesis protein
MLLAQRMGQSIVVVDAFAEQPFTGNPAAVCVLNQPGDERWMQLVAREVNLSETAFLFPEGDAFRLRWFTPTVEVDLCGHATLASAHVLWESGRLRTTEEARFQTRSGLLTARRDGDRIVLDFPAVEAQACEPPPGLAEAIGAPVGYTAKSVFDYLVELGSETIVRTLRPDFVRLAALPTRGVMVTSRSDDPAFDFVSRFFAPSFGIPEDPVTGSAHCCLGPHWSGRLGKSDLVGHQVSARGGIVRVAVRGERVHLGGNAITIMRGELSTLCR